jgi:hypothetical protein
MNVKKIIFSIASILLFPLATASAADLRLTTSPLPINLKVEPGVSISTPLKIKNDGLSSENIKVSLMKFKADSITGVPTLSEREPGDNYFDWASFSENSFTLPANEWKTITATFNVPKEASFGYYYAVVFSRAEENVEKNERQTIINGGTAVLVLLEANVPNAKREVTVTDFSVDKAMYEFLPATFSIKLRNTGNVHIAPRGNIFISQGENKDVAILEVNPNRGSILPDSPRDFTESWSDGFPYYVDKQLDNKTILDENNSPEKELKWDFKDASKLRWGKYTAKLLLVYDDGKKDVPVEATVEFWVMPWRLIGGGILILIFVLIGLKSTLQSWYKKIKGVVGKNKK